MVSKMRFISIIFAILLVGSLVPINALSADDVNEYSLEVANLIKEKCHGNCDNVILLGDDYVIPSFRRSIRWLSGLWFWEDLKVDRILTDIGYIQRKSKTFAELDKLVTKQLDGRNYEGKNILFILPDNPTDDQTAAIGGLQSEFESKFKSHIYNKSGDDVVCNDPNLWDNMNGYNLVVIGTEDNNYAYNCFPFQVGLENRNSAFIDVNPWDGRNYAVIINTDDSEVINLFTELIRTGEYKNIKSESAYFFRIGTRTAGYVALFLAVSAVIIGTGGTAAPAILTGAAWAADIAADGSDVADSCHINKESAGWCGASIAFMVLPFVPGGPFKRALSGAVDSPLFKKFVNIFGRVTKYFDGDDIKRVVKSSDDASTEIRKGWQRYLRGISGEADQFRHLDNIPLTKSDRLEFLRKLGNAETSLELGEETIKKIEFVDRKILKGADGDWNSYARTIRIADDLKVPKKIDFVMSHEMAHAKIFEDMNFKETWTRIDSRKLIELDDTNILFESTREYEEFLAENLVKLKVDNFYFKELDGIVDIDDIYISYLSNIINGWKLDTVSKWAAVAKLNDPSKYNMIKQGIIKKFDKSDEILDLADEFIKNVDHNLLTKEPINVIAEKTAELRGFI